MQKKKLGIVLRKLMNLEYGNNNILIIEECLKKLEFKKKNRLPKYVKKKLIDHWVKDKINDDIMKPYSYVIDPIDDIDILIKLEDKNYLALTLVENRGHYPVYKRMINKEYIYIVVLEKRIESIFYSGKHILDDSKMNSILDFYNNILEMKQRLDSELKNYKCSVQLDIKDSNVSPFEYGRTRRCLDTIDDIYENLDRKVLDFDSLLND